MQGNIEGKVKQVLNILRPAQAATTTPQETSAPIGTTLPPATTKTPNYLNPIVNAKKAST